jgi:hypothetical protein
LGVSSHNQENFATYLKIFLVQFQKVFGKNGAGVMDREFSL